MAHYGTALSPPFLYSSSSYTAGRPHDPISLLESRSRSKETCEKDGGWSAERVAETLQRRAARMVSGGVVTTSNAPVHSMLEERRHSAADPTEAESYPSNSLFHSVEERKEEEDDVDVDGPGCCRDWEEMGSLSRSDKGALLQSAHRLIRRYRMENDRLRSQLHAADVRQAWLTRRVEELALKGARAGGGHEEEGRALNRIVELEAHSAALEGRLAAYEDIPVNLQQKGEVAAAGALENRLEKASDEVLSSHLLQCRRYSGFLVKVVNAIRHIRFDPHQDTNEHSQLANSDHRTEEKKAKELCPSTRLQCQLRCLAATEAGAESEENEPGKETMNDGTERKHLLARAVKEVEQELAYCERVSREMARALLSDLSLEAKENSEKPCMRGVDKKEKDKKSMASHRQHAKGTAKERMIHTLQQENSSAVGPQLDKEDCAVQ